MAAKFAGAGAAAGTLGPQAVDCRLGTAAGRGEVDTSSQFRSVREAVVRFSGSAPWKPQLERPILLPEEVQLMKVEEQTVKVEMDLFVKERETLNILKEIEMTKRIVDDLKLRLQKEATTVFENQELHSEDMKVHPIQDAEEKNHRYYENHGKYTGQDMVRKHSILMELKQARLNLNSLNLSRTTNSLDGIRASVDLLKNKLEKEKVLLEKTRARLRSNTGKASLLEQELNKRTAELQLIRDAKGKGCNTSSDILSQINHLSSEKEQYKKMTVAAKSEISRLTSEIEQTKSSIKTTEVRWLAAMKMKEAAKSREAIALLEIKALRDNDNSAAALQSPSEVMLSVEEFATISRKAQEADELVRKKLEAAILGVEVAEKSKLDLLGKVEEVTADVETSRKALREALKREEAANRGKVAIEEALWRWRSEHGCKQRPVNISNKFKNACATPRRGGSHMLDVNGLGLVTSESSSPRGQTLSIGQILSRKLMDPEKYEAQICEKIIGKPRISLGQILSIRNEVSSHQKVDAPDARKQVGRKRKKFGFVGFSVRVVMKAKNSKKMRSQQALSSPGGCRTNLV